MKKLRVRFSDGTEEVFEYHYRVNTDNEIILEPKTDRVIHIVKYNVKWYKFE